MTSELARTQKWRTEHGFKDRKYIHIYKDRNHNAVISYSEDTVYRSGHGGISYIIGHYKDDDEATIEVTNPQNLLSFIEDIGFDIINDIIELHKNEENLIVVDEYGHKELHRKSGKEMR